MQTMDDDEFPHVYGLASMPLPDGMQPCALCESMHGRSEIAAFDEDLTGFLCRACTPHVFAAEGNLVAAGMRRPSLAQLMEIEGR